MKIAVLLIVGNFQTVTPGSKVVRLVDKNLGLVDIKSINPNIIVDLRYATTNNFTKQKVYNFTRCLVLKQVALKLDLVQKTLAKKGLGLKLWDGYRPVAAQEKFWSICPDERYVTNPKDGGRHTRGTTVDVTLVDKYGQELLMPTDFDDFTELAHRNYTKISSEVKSNRDLLRAVMEERGFTGIECEWWHFDYLDWRKSPPLSFDVNAYVE